MYSENFLLEFLRHASLEHDDAPFAIVHETGETVSYGDFFANVERAAAALIRAGLQPGDRVAAQTEKSIAALELYLGAVLAGGVYLPLNTAYTPHEVEYFLNDANPTVFVCQPSTIDTLTPIAKKANVTTIWSLGEDNDVDFISARDAETSGFAGIERHADDLAAILYTSGTTGRSKGAMLSHRALQTNAATLRDYWHFTRADILIHALPIFHIHGLFVAINISLAAGSSLHFMKSFDARAIIDEMQSASVLMGVPTFYTRLLAEDALTRENARDMRLFISGSAPLLSETHEQFEKRTGHRILERYGMTETGMNTSNPHNGDRRAGTVGHALPGVSVRITDPPTGRELPDGEKGAIEIKGDNLFSGYWGMPEKTATEFRDDGFFITGDIGLRDSDGYISIVGRSKDMIISGGYNIYPKEIESIVDPMPGVRESAVFGVPHPDFGEGVVCVIVPSDSSIDLQAISSALQGQLARYKQPRKIDIIRELPRNTMGKVQKNILRNEYENAFSA